MPPVQAACRVIVLAGLGIAPAETVNWASAPLMYPDDVGRLPGHEFGRTPIVPVVAACVGVKHNTPGVVPVVFALHAMKYNVFAAKDKPSDVPIVPHAAEAVENVREAVNRARSDERYTAPV